MTESASDISRGSGTRNDSPQDQNVDPVAQARSRRMLLLIFGMFGVPLLLAIIWLQLVQSSDGELGSTARGELIDPPVPLKAFSVPLEDGETLKLVDLLGEWTLLYAPEGVCGDTCKLKLYYMRQVRLALNQRMDRVHRVVVTDSADQLGGALLKEHPGLLVTTGSASQRLSLLGQIDAAVEGMKPMQDSIYLIDPLGNVMLRFPPDLPPKSILKDLTHLLKVSRIG